MGMKKANDEIYGKSIGDAPMKLLAKAQAKESGLEAAVARLTENIDATFGDPVIKTSNVSDVSNCKPYKARDFDAEARGKTRCVQFEAAVMSPSIAGMKWKSPEEFLAIVKQVADAGVKYTFGE